MELEPLRRRGRRAVAAALLLAPVSLWAGADAPPRFTGSAQVTGSRLTDDPAAVGRREVILTREEISRLPVHTLQDVLAVLPGVGLSRRGARGVQADLGLRGGTFEQAAVLVNGVRVSNPQTGHHHLDLFIPAAAIDRVEVLYGPGSAVYGPDAFGGAINIVTGAPPVTVETRAGDHGLAGAVAAGAAGPAWAALEREVHSGFRDDTEHDVDQAAAGVGWIMGATRLELAAAVGRRHFGAWRFYSNRFPLERERTSGRLLTGSLDTPVGGARLRVALRLDGHHDDFILDRSRPSFYRNLHDTRGALADAVLEGRIADWDLAAGCEAARDEIDSSSLGRHHRSRGAVFAEVGRLQGRTTGALQLRFDRQQPWGRVGTVAVGGSTPIAGSARLRLHHGESFRAPSFTELYYHAPDTVGDPDLTPERGRSSELGVDWGPVGVTAFVRRADRLIDYRLGDDGVWRAANVGRLATRGLEAALLFPVSGPLVWQRLGAVWLDSSFAGDPARSRYALAHPRLEAAYTGAADVGRGWRSGWALRVRDPREGGWWWTLDLRLDRAVGHGLSVSLEGDNLLDREVSELGGIPLPGRWLSVAVSYREDAP